MNHLDLFSGIGGFSLGLRMAGEFNTVAFCEIETWCHRVLNKHWPNVPIFEDVKDVTAGSVYERTRGQRIDVITAGVPCQPASVAGKQLGTEDDRWLWPDAIRIIADIKPRWIILENPDGIYSVGISGILSELESLGYSNGQRADGKPCIHPIEVPACALGAPILRNRVFIVACSSSFNTIESTKSTFAKRNKEWMLSKSIGLCDDYSNLDVSNDSNGQGQPISIQSRRQEQTGTDVNWSSDSVMGSTGSERLARWPDIRGNHEPQFTTSERANHWDDSQYLYCPFDQKYRRVTDFEPSVQCMADGVSGRLDGLRIPLTINVKPRSVESKEMKARLKAVGNSVNPQTVAEIGRAILVVEAGCLEEAA